VGLPFIICCQRNLLSNPSLSLITLNRSNFPFKLIFLYRTHVNLTVGAAATAIAVNTTLAFGAQKPRIKAIAFDAFPIFDPGPVFALVNSLFPEKGVALTNTWRATQFDYSWLRTTAGQYADFWKVTEDALVFAARKNEVELSAANREQLMEAYLHLNAWPDVLPALKVLKQQGIKMCFLSNFTAAMLNANIKNAGLEGYFDAVLSTDKVKMFKPSPVAYQMAIDNLKLKKEEIAFAAFAGWDAVGAKWFGYPSYWVNRQNNPLDELNILPDDSGKDLTGLINFVK
jgi:2-haloacid dehalogenase